MQISREEWANIRRDFLRTEAAQGIALELRDRVWAVTPEGEWIALPGASESPLPDRWWLGCDPRKLERRRPKGIILLCQARGSLYPIGIPRKQLESLEPHLSRNEKQVFFNVTRRGKRFLLQLRGGREVDVTSNLNDLSWLAPTAGTLEPASPADAARETPDSATPYGPRVSEPGGVVSRRFFATFRSGSLDPVDQVDLDDGAAYLVEVQQVPAIPGSPSLRRIVARGGPSDLPPDFAERHDLYRRRHVDR